MRNIITVFALILSLSGCIIDHGREAERFGAHYDLLQTGTLPSLTADSLFARVSYSGCSGNHVFSLKYRTTGRFTVEVWLYKETASEMCDAYYEETKALGLPPEIQNYQKVTLVGPLGENIILRR